MGEEFNYDLYFELLDKDCPLMLRQQSDVLTIMTQTSVASWHLVTVKLLVSLLFPPRESYTANPEH